MGCCLSKSSTDNLDSTREDAQTLQRTTATSSPSDHRQSIATETSIRLHANSDDGLPLAERKTAPLKKHVWSAKGDMSKRIRISRMRDEFYDTRISGRLEVWQALRYSIELMEDGDLATAQEILRAGGVTVPTGQFCFPCGLPFVCSVANICEGDLVDGAFDQSGQRYDLPSYCCSFPVNVIDAPDDQPAEKNSSEEDLDIVQSEEELEQRREAKGKRPAVSLGGKKRLRIRLSDKGTDLIVRFDDDDIVRVIRRKIMEQAGVSYRLHIHTVNQALTNRFLVNTRSGQSSNGISRQDVRYPTAPPLQCYLGTLANGVNRLKDTETLAEQGWSEGHILNAFVFPGS